MLLMLLILDRVLIGYNENWDLLSFLEKWDLVHWELDLITIFGHWEWNLKQMWAGSWNLSKIFVFFLETEDTRRQTRTSAIFLTNKN